MACRYCDTDFKGPYREFDREQLSAEVRTRIERDGPFHAVSLTGGEPLLWSRFLQQWLPELKTMKQTTYLETNGTLPDALAQVLPWIDIIAMDLKPVSATGDRPFWNEHRRFLQIAQEGARHLDAWHRPEVFVKVVVTADTAESELQQVVDLVASIDSEIPLVLQPVTPWGAVKESPAWDALAVWRRQASEKLAGVRVLPQVHRLLGVP